MAAVEQAAKEDGRPVQLIQIDDAGQCHMQEEATSIIQKYHGRIAVVGIAGLYRTGKSFLLNRLVGRQSGFEVGPTVNPCTKGIWMWGHPVQIAPDFHCLFIDTEGLGSAQRTTSCDMQIFSLCILLSSFFIYNSMGAIDEQSLQDLHLVLNIAKHVHVKSGGGREEHLSTYFPSFLWVLRDFHLKLMNKNGATITTRDYLEESLCPIPGEDEKTSIRGAIRDLFPVRDCVTLVRPVADESDLRHVEKLPYENLRSEFRSQVEAFVNKVYAALKPKQIGGATVSGPMFVALCTEYCNAINNSAVPAIQSAWASAVQHQLRTSLRDAMQEYNRQVADELMASLPLPESELQERLRAAETEALRIFSEPGFSETDPNYAEYREELTGRLLQMRKRAEDDNTEASRRQCKAVAQELYDTIINNKLTSRGYTSFDQLGGDWTRLRVEFLNRTAGPSQADVLGSFLMERMTDSMQRVHDQLKVNAHDKFDKLQLDHHAALEQERKQLYGSLEQARTVWAQEKEDLEKKIEVAGEQVATMERQRLDVEEAVKQKERIEAALPWRRSKALSPTLKDGRSPTDPNGLQTETTATLLSSREEHLPVRTSEGMPSAKRRSRAPPKYGEDDFSIATDTMNSIVTNPMASNSTIPQTEIGDHRPSDLSSLLSFRTNYPDWSFKPELPQWSSSMTAPISMNSAKGFVREEIKGALKPPVAVKGGADPPPTYAQPFATHTGRELSGVQEGSPKDFEDEELDLSSQVQDAQCGPKGCALQ